VRSAALLLLAAPGASPAAAQQEPVRATIAAPAKPADKEDAILVQQDTPIRLMVLHEVSTRSAQAGDRFVLRVDEPVIVEGVTVIPVGAKAWGEVLAAQKSGHVGKAGKISARLLSVEVGGQQIPISGENKSAGESGVNQVALGALGLGPFALFARGNNAKLKAGDIFSAYFDADMLFDRGSATLSLLSARPIAAK
jgi:hypothetical protein